MTIKRKIVGWQYSKLVCIPKQWLTMNNLDKGDFLLIETDEKGRLILTGEKRVKSA